MSISLFGKEEIGAEVVMAERARTTHFRNSPVQHKECQQKTTECEMLGATAKHDPSQLHQENTAESVTEANIQDISTALHTSPSLMIFHGEAVIAKDLDKAKDKEKTHSACHVTDESEERPTQRMRRHGVCKAKYEARDKEEENSASYTTEESKEKQRQQMRRQVVCEAKDEAADKEGDNLTRASPTTNESGVRQREQMRRQGVCQAVDETAARRRRARVLKKRLFGDDLPNDDELTVQRALNKRM